MMKRFFSKRSGFTLVEILVAFAIFTIMMSMIMQVLQLSVAARQQNTQKSRERAGQEEQLLLGKDLTYDKDADETGKVGLKFGEDKEYELEYQIKGTNDENPDEGLNYFVGNVDYKAAVADPDKVENKSKSGSQMSQYDTRITGTANIGDIKINVSDSGNGRYIITLQANSNNVEDEMKIYTQIRLYFYDDSQIYSDVYEYVDGYVETGDGPSTSDIKQYKKCSVPAYAKEVGLIGGSQITNRISKDDSEKQILLQGLGNSVRISYYSKAVFNGSPIKFYVQFDEDNDPGITSASFGNNGEADGSYVTYTKYEHKEGKEVIQEKNIYGAIPYEIGESDFGGIWVAGKDDWDKRPGRNLKLVGSSEEDPDKGETPDPNPGGETPGPGGEGGETPDPNPGGETPNPGGETPNPGGESTPDTPVEGGGE